MYVTNLEVWPIIGLPLKPIFKYQLDFYVYITYIFKICIFQFKSRKRSCGFLYKNKLLNKLFVI